MTKKDSFGPANDTARARLELRAAEMAFCVYAPRPCTDAEFAGWVAYVEGGDVPAGASPRKQLQWQTGYLARELHCAEIEGLYGTATAEAQEEAVADFAEEREGTVGNAADLAVAVEAEDHDVSEEDVPTPLDEYAGLERDPEVLDAAAVALFESGAAEPEPVPEPVEADPSFVAAGALFESGATAPDPEPVEADPSFADAGTPCEGVPHSSPQWNADLDAMELAENSPV